MISIESAMLVALGFSAATLLGFLLAPVYRRRAQRLAIAELKATLPITSQEIAADKDRLRAQFALTIHSLERKLEKAAHATAKQMVEINRRDAGISALESEVQRLRTLLEEHENARRVLEQTIVERLPKVEHRLAEAKKMLVQRDREIAALTQSAERQSQALEEAAGINAQQRDEIHRLNATLKARGARNRHALSDPRFDAEVALRTEIEALRAKARDQSALINRLQEALAKAGERSDHVSTGEVFLVNGYVTGNGYESEISRLRKNLTEAEVALKSAQGTAEMGDADRAALQFEIRSLRAVNEDQLAEIAKLKAALKAYETEDGDERAIKESKVALRARLSALKAQADEQTATIQRLRAEMAAGNEKLAIQAQYFAEEMRRLGVGTLPASGGRAKDGEASQSLVERIRAPRLPRELRAASKPQREALDGAEQDQHGDAAAENPDASSVEPEAATEEGAEDGAGLRRRPGLLERIMGVEKPVA